MKKISDYIFSNSWQLEKLDLIQGSDYLILNDVGDLRKDQIVKFSGFDDVDNHYGIFVFIDPAGKILEVKGDFSGPEHHSFKELQSAIKKH